MDQAAARALDREPHGVAVTKTAAKTERKENPIFIRSELDDYGLTPNEFRVLARISRRAGDVGACWESIPNMAEALELSANTVRRCCQVLALARLISEVNRDGETTERRVRPIVEWKNKAELPGIRRIVLGTTEKKRTPTMRDRGSRRAGSTPLPPETGAPLPQQTGLPLPPEIDEGDPFEVHPNEGNPKKEIQSKVIPHTQAIGAEVIDGIVSESAVCVAIPFDLGQIRKQYAEMHSFPYSKQINNPGGWLVKAQDGRYDDLLVLPWWREQEDARRRSAEEEAANERMRIAREEFEASQRALRDDEESAKAQEWERNAPLRERERAERLEAERTEAIQACQLFWHQFANNPKLRDSLIGSTLPTDEQSRAEFRAWVESQQSGKKVAT